MRKGYVAGLGVVVVVAAVAAGTPWFIGKQVETRMQSWVAAVDRNPVIQVSIKKYDRRWLDADAVLEVKLPEDLGSYPVKIHVVHGPRQHLSWFDMTLTPEFDNKLVGAMFGDKPPVRATFREAIFGDSVLDVTSPKGKLQHGHDYLDWGGARLHVVNGRKADLTVPGLEAGDDDGSVLSIKNVTVTATSSLPLLSGKLPRKAADWASDFKLQVGQLSWDPPSGYHRHGRFHASTQVAYETHLRSDADGMLNMKQRLAFDNVRLMREGSARKPLELTSWTNTLNVSGIKADAVVRTVADYRKMAAAIADFRGGERPSDEDLKQFRAKYNAMRQQLGKDIAAMLGGAPVVNLDVLAESPNNGQLEANAHVELAKADAGTPIPSRLTFSSKQSMTVPMVAMLMAYISDTPVDAAQLKARLERQGAFMAGDGSGMQLPYDDGKVHHSLQYDGKQGTLKINGKKADPATQRALVRRLMQLLD